MRVLVTGGTGFIGYHTARRLADAGHTVRLLVRNEEKARQLYGDELPEMALSDIADQDGVKRALDGCDAVIHTAAMVSVDPRDADVVYRTNTEGTCNVIGQAVDMGIQRISHVSSVTAIFDESATLLNEDSPPGTASNAYGRSKVDSERYVRELQAQGAPIVITYPASVIGPEDPALTEPHVGLITNLYATFMMPGGNQWVDVRDIAAAQVTIIENDLAPARYCLGGHFLSWRELGAVLGELTGRRLLPLPLFGVTMRSLGRVMDVVQPMLGTDTPITYEAMVYATRWVNLDNTKAERELGLTFRPVHDSIRDALVSLCERGELGPRLAGKLAAK
ncbi:MAG: SDR family NAD(P)-dependent oxidoreductase [Halioglobus sp.]